jgi:hypothetical protein
MNNWTRDDGNYNFSGYTPLNISAVWAINTDFARISWNDIYGGQVAYDVWESKDQGLHWLLVATTAIGANQYDNFTYQNALMQFKVAPHGTSEFSNPVQLQTPLCFWTDEAFVPGVILNNLDVAALRTVHVEWGDGMFDDLVGANPMFAQAYANPGQYCVQFSGDVNFITRFDCQGQATNYGDLGKWVLPGNLTVLILNMSAFTGDLHEWILPGGLTNLDLTWNLFTGDISGWFNMGGMPPGMTYFNISGTNLFSGAVPEIFAGATLPNGITTFDANTMLFTGNLRNFLLPAAGAAFTINLNDNNFGSILRGNYRWCTVMNMANNNVSYQEINDFLSYLDNFFTLGVVPLCNLTLTITGANMGSPEGGVFSDAIISLTAKYIAAGFVFTCVHN